MARDAITGEYWSTRFFGHRVLDASNGLDTLSYKRDFDLGRAEFGHSAASASCLSCFHGCLRKQPADYLFVREFVTGFHFLKHWELLCAKMTPPGVNTDFDTGVECRQALEELRWPATREVPARRVRDFSHLHGQSVRLRLMPLPLFGDHRNRVS